MVGLLLDEFLAFEKKERNDMDRNIGLDDWPEGSQELDKSLLCAAVSRMSIQAAEFIVEIVDSLHHVLC